MLRNLPYQVFVKEGTVCKPSIIWSTFCWPKQEFIDDATSGSDLSGEFYGQHFKLVVPLEPFNGKALENLWFFKKNVLVSCIPSLPSTNEGFKQGKL